MSDVPAPVVRAVDPQHDLAAWARMRLALWPGEADVDSRESLQAALLPVGDACVLLAFADGRAIGFAEARRRHEYVNGTGSSPVGFLEGWYVDPDWRGRGVGRALVRGIESWACAQGCLELASDALLDNAGAHAAHLHCGFEETERVVFFRKPLGATS